MTGTRKQISGGHYAVESLLRHGVQTLFCVPGESYLAVLDSVYDVADRLRLISCRHESGAAFMALANAQLTGRPGACFVTRGPGATNASIALHVARQASIPMVLGVGQVARANLGRESFQEIDYAAFFAPLVKHVEQVTDPAAVSEAFARAFALAAEGRPGPVVLALPEDVLSGTADVNDAAPLPVTRQAPGEDSWARLLAMLAAAERPLLIVGGSRIDDQVAADIRTFAERHRLPVATSFRRQDSIDNTSDCYAGYFGYSAHAALTTLVADADCVVVLGARLDEPTTQSYTLFKDGRPRKLIHVYPGARELTLNYAPDLAICADIAPTAARFATLDLTQRWPDWCARLRTAYLAAVLPQVECGLDPATVMERLNARLPDDAIVTSDAGNFTLWPQRGRRYRRPGRLLAPINGAMGYGVPAAVGASLTCPQRTVIGCVGDGGMGMTGMELATAAQYGATPLILVFNNSKYGTIEMHQDRRYPGRRIGNALQNPDFAALARSFGLFGARVDDNESFDDALESGLRAGCAGLIELVLAPQ